MDKELIPALIIAAANDLDLGLPEINISKMPDEIRAYTKFPHQVLNFNDKWLKKANHIEMAGVVFHEMRHLWQFKQILLGDDNLEDLKISIQEYELWKDELKQKEAGELALDAILAIEVDAYAYANLQLEKLLVPLEEFENSELKKLVSLRMEAIRK
ncbi:MAG TPA: hypothetical protein GXZ51_01525 [Acholeplasma sp.]|jgi:hypothetical protein|nr:hypothetical protein [Acholeplasma sp.]